MTTIGIFGPPDDQEVRILAHRLSHRGAEPWIIDLGSYPEGLKIAHTTDGFTVDGRPILDVDAAFVRRVDTNLPMHLRYQAPIDNPAESLSSRLQFGRVEEAGEPEKWKSLYRQTGRDLKAALATQSIRTTVVETLSRKRTVFNVPSKQNLHRLKTFELRELQRSGLNVPCFAAGAHRDKLLEFARSAKDNQWDGVVTKPPAGIYKTALWTEPFHQQHPWKTRPVLFQRFIRGDTVRCYVLSGKLLSSARIVHQGTIDSSVSQTGIEVIELSAQARALAEGTAKALALPFCGMDLMLDASTQEPYIIDCNISPMFVNYGKLSRVDIAAHLAGTLIECAGRHVTIKKPPVLDLMKDAKNLLSEIQGPGSRTRGKGSKEES